MRYLRWATGEWAYEAAGSEHFERVTALLNGDDLYDEEEDLDEDAFEKSADFLAYRNQVFDTLVLALRDLDAEGFFGTGAAREAVTLLCTVSDSELSANLEQDSVRRLNPPAASARFQAGGSGTWH